MSFDVTDTTSDASLYDVIETTVSYVLDNMTSEVNNQTTTAPAVAAGRATTLPGLVDAATKDLVVEIVNCYLLPIVVVAGAVGNAMSFVVLLVHGMNNSTNVLLTAVTISDFCFLVTMYIRKVSCIVSKFDDIMGQTLERGLLPTVYMVNRIFQLSTPFLTMLITLERCLAVSLPFKVSEIVTPLRMKVAVVVVYIMSAIFIIPFFFIYEVKWIPNSAGDQIPMVVGTKFFYENYDIISSYNNIALSGIFFFGPMAIVLVCTIFIFTAIKKSARWRQVTSKNGERPEERRMTRLLMTVVVVYLGAYIPAGAIGIANQATPDFGSIGGRYNNLFYLVAGLQLLLYALRSSSNFVIYMLLSKKFLDTYRRIFLCRKDGDGKQTTRSKATNQKSITTKTDLSSKTEESSTQGATKEEGEAT